MKIKSLLLISLFLMSGYSSALSLDSYVAVNTKSYSYPSALSDEYYANTYGIYRIGDTSLNMIEKLNSGRRILDIFDDYALGYSGYEYGTGPNYFICEIESCLSSIKPISGIDYELGEVQTHTRSGLNYISENGHIVIAGSKEQNGDTYHISVVNLRGEILDSFPVKGSKYAGLKHLVATTGITKELDFKMMTSSFGEYFLKLKRWNNELSKIEDVQIFDRNGSEINTVYASGLAPFYISDPYIAVSGEKTYKVFFVTLDSVTNVTKKIMWGDVSITDGSANFVNDISEIDFNVDITSGFLTSSNPILHSNGDFTFSGYKLSGGVLVGGSNTHPELTLQSKIHAKSNNGSLLIKAENGYAYIFIKPSLILSGPNNYVDPYVDSSLDIKLGLSPIFQYGVEAVCQLHKSNVSLDFSEYIPLSETALQIPIEWDSLTGQWKGAQSLTGVESLSGSKEFAQFDLTADVTTGTWTMSCSGIASDIEGNKIALNPAEITINLDDKIHGGANIISGQIDIPNTTNYSGVVVTITLNGRQIEVTTQEDGSFEFDRLVDGDYTVHVFSDQYVAACTNLTLSSDNINPVLNIPMYAGDINNDGGVDIGDFSLLSSLYGMNSEDEEYNALADLNHDGVINVQDLSILGSHFGVDHCEVAPQ